MSPKSGDGRWVGGSVCVCGKGAGGGGGALGGVKSDEFVLVSTVSFPCALSVMNLPHPPVRHLSLSILFLKIYFLFVLIFNLH